jgi:hypothetical protein
MQFLSIICFSFWHKCCHILLSEFNTDFVTFFSKNIICFETEWRVKFLFLSHFNWSTFQMLSALTDKFVKEHNRKQTQSNLYYRIPTNNDLMSVKPIQVVLINEWIYKQWPPSNYVQPSLSSGLRCQMYNSL